MRSVLLALFLALGLSGCAAMTEMYRESYCNYDGAFKKGMNDAQSGGAMDEGFSYPCHTSDKLEAERGYREGYRLGRPNRIIIQSTRGT